MGNPRHTRAEFLWFKRTSTPSNLRLLWSYRHGYDPSRLISAAIIDKCILIELNLTVSLYSSMLTRSRFSPPLDAAGTLVIKDHTASHAGSQIQTEKGPPTSSVIDECGSTLTSGHRYSVLSYHRLTYTIDHSTAGVFEYHPILRAVPRTHYPQGPLTTVRCTLSDVYQYGQNPFCVAGNMRAKDGLTTPEILTGW